MSRHSLSLSPLLSATACLLWCLCVLVLWCSSSAGVCVCVCLSVLAASDVLATAVPIHTAEEKGRGVLSMCYYVANGRERMKRKREQTQTTNLNEWEREKESCSSTIALVETEEKATEDSCEQLSEQLGNLVNQEEERREKQKQSQHLLTCSWSGARKSRHCLGSDYLKPTFFPFHCFFFSAPDDLIRGGTIKFRKVRWGEDERENELWKHF